MVLDWLNLLFLGGSFAGAKAGAQVEVAKVGARVEVAQPEVIKYARVSNNIVHKKIRYIQLPVVSVHKRFVRHHPLKSILKKVKKIFG